MARLKTLLFVFSCFFLAACSKYSYHSLPTECLHFGSKGGVAGELRTYILLLDNRRLFFKDPLKEEMEKIGRVNTALLRQVEEIIPNLPYDRSLPSNYNAVLRYYTEKGVRELQWLAPQGAPDEATQSLFEQLMGEARRLRKLD